MSLFNLIQKHIIISVALKLLCQNLVIIIIIFLPHHCDALKETNETSKKNFNIYFSFLELKVLQYRLIQ